ncbi:MAG: hypothetical protein AAGJ40_05310 [Planctomycetota bacterium]
MTKRILILSAYLWASPNTLFAIALGMLLGGRMRLHSGVLEIHGHRVRRVLASMPIAANAMTMGHVVFGQSPVALDRTRLHERVHVHQYERWGPFFIPAYLACSAYLYLVGRDGYRDNPFEVAAYAVDDPGHPRLRTGHPTE